MVSFTLPVHEGLLEGSRLHTFIAADRPATIGELAKLVGFGALAAILSTYGDLGLRLPGHAILRAIFPMALGLALVPRRGAGSVMGLSALLTAAVLRTIPGAGHGMSLGALTSLTLTGPLLDVSLQRFARGGSLHVGFALAGLASNLVALLVRGSAKSVGLDHGGAQAFSIWLAPATVSYIACGLLAGLISGCIWFRLREPSEREEPAG